MSVFRGNFKSSVLDTGYDPHIETITVTTTVPFGRSLKSTVEETEPEAVTVRNKISVPTPTIDDAVVTSPSFLVTPDELYPNIKKGYTMSGMVNFQTIIQLDPFIWDIQCHHCMEIMFDYASKITHILETHNTATSIFCVYCTHKTSTRPEMELHVKLHRVDIASNRWYLFVCPLVGCVTLSSTYQDNYNHITTAHTGEVKACNVCSMLFVNKTYLKAHNTHLHPKPSTSTNPHKYKCRVSGCPYGADSLITLRHHFADAHDQN